MKIEDMTFAQVAMLTGKLILSFLSLVIFLGLLEASLTLDPCTPVIEWLDSIFNFL